MSSDKIIGSGKFGKVLEIEDYKGEKIAYKIISPNQLNLVEVDILSRVKSPYLIRSLGKIENNYNIESGLTMELKENNLDNLNYKDLSPGNIKRIFMSLVYGIECLHKSGYLHLDLKTRNCLFDSKSGIYTAYISDFGSSFRVQNPQDGIVRSNRVGTLKYWPYEILTKEDKYVFNDKSDIWSLGVTFLVFIGFEYKPNFNSQEPVDYKCSKIKKFWDNLDLNNVIKSLVNNLDLSQNEKIDFIEMLTLMLKKDTSLRISSKDLKKLRFYKNNIFSNSCYVSKPKEIFYIPYTSSNVLFGLTQINKYFENQALDFDIEIYFLTVEIFIRLMSCSPMEISKQTLESHIQLSFIGAAKYYKKFKLSERNQKIYNFFSYKLVDYLEGDIAPNIYFYSSKYAHDLVLVKEILFKNYNLLAMYSYINKKNLFEYFRQNYEYDMNEKDKILTYRDLMEYSLPERKTETAIEDDRSIFSYKNLKTEEKIIPEVVSSIQRIRNIEDVVVKNIKSYTGGELEKIKIDNPLKFYSEHFKGREQTIIDIFSEYKNFSIITNVPGLEDSSFGIIKEDSFDRLTEIKNLNYNYIIFKSKDDNFSLLVRKDREIIHYFSKFKQNLYDFFAGEGVLYSNNYKYETQYVCKINEICILFLVIYYIYRGFDTEDSIFIQDETMEIILKFSYFLIYKI